MELFNEISPSGLFSTFTYSLLGLILMLIAYGAIEKITPFSVRKEIEEDQNTSLGIIIGCMMLGISIIIAATILSPSDVLSDGSDNAPVSTEATNPKAR